MKKYLLILLIIFLGHRSLTASAAILYLSPETQSFGVGQEFTLDLLLDTENVNINAAQAVIHYPPEILEFVSADRAKSIFNFWVEEPAFSNGALSFIGGTDRDVSGKSLLIFSSRFKTIGAGAAAFTLSDGVVAASDGKGTNALSSIKGASVAISPTEISVPAPPLIQEQPQKIVREPAPALKLPTSPEVKVNLYPDQSKWYNYFGEVIALWNVPEDVIQVAAAIDQNPNTILTKFDAELFNGRNFGPLKEGIWYVHVRFKNNIGAGPTVHYRLSLDAIPPVDFALSFNEGIATDNPQPTLNFQTNDALSGLDRYELQINSGAAITISANWSYYQLPLQAPGKHLIRVGAIDKANNVTEGNIEIEIIPIPSPTITLLSKDFLVRGTAAEEVTIKILVKKKTGDIVAEGVAAADKSGNWEALINQPLKKGQHFVEVTAQDQRGALSLSVKSELFKVREKPLITIAGIGITQFWFFAGLLILLLVGFGVGGFSYRIWRTQLGRKAVVAQRDIAAMSNLLQKDIDKILTSYADKRVDEREAAEIEFLIKKIKDNLEKTKKYVTENIGEISK